MFANLKNWQHILCSACILTVGACSAEPINQPVIGEIDSITWTMGPSFQRVTKSPFPDEEIVITNACGFISAKIIGIDVYNSENRKIEIGQSVSEWCTDPYATYIGNDYVYVIPGTIWDGPSYQNGKYYASIFPIYITEDDLLLDISPEHSRGQHHPPLQDSDLKAVFKRNLIALDSPIFIAEGISKTEFDEHYTPDYFSLENGDVFLIKAVSLKAIHPDTTQTLLARDK